MDTKLLLVKSVTLLYLESKLPNKSVTSSDIITQLISLIKTTETTIVGIDYGKDPIMALRETLRWMAANPVDTTYDKSELLQRIRVNIGDDDALYAAIVDGIDNDIDGDFLQKRIHSYRNQLRGYLETIRARDHVKKAYMKMHYNTNEIVDFGAYIKDLRQDLLAFEENPDDAGREHRGLVSEINFRDLSSIKREFGAMKDEISSNGALRFGLQGFNRMLGSARGGRRGELMVVGALQHNYKSGFALDLLRHAAMYNTPYMFNRERKPLLLRISLENPARNDIMHLYKSIVEQDTGLPVDLENLDVDEASFYVKAVMEKNGYEVILRHYDPSDFTYHDLFELIEKYEADGYEIHMLNIDYLNLMNKRGCEGGPMGADTRSLFRRVRNFINSKDRRIFTITPHQLSTDAKIMTRAGVTNFVKEIANKGYYDSCRTLDQEVDLEIYLHKEVINGEAYLTIQRGKHRGLPIITPANDLYCVYKFEAVGNIVDDYLRDDMSRRMVGGGTAIQGFEAPWYHGQ